MDVLALMDLGLGFTGHTVDGDVLTPGPDTRDEASLLCVDTLEGGGKESLCTPRYGYRVLRSVKLSTLFAVFRHFDAVVGQGRMYFCSRASALLDPLCQAR